MGEGMVRAGCGSAAGAGGERLRGALNGIGCSTVIKHTIKHTRLPPSKKGTEGSLPLLCARGECVKEERKDGAVPAEDVRPQQDACSSCISINNKALVMLIVAISSDMICIQIVCMLITLCT